MQIKGKISQKMIRKGVLGETYFDEEFKFMSEETDPLSKQARSTTSLSPRAYSHAHLYPTRWQTLRFRRLRRRIACMTARCFSDGLVMLP
jgi:hypothetical protein